MWSFGSLVLLFVSVGAQEVASVPGGFLPVREEAGQLSPVHPTAAPVISLGIIFVFIVT